MAIVAGSIGETAMEMLVFAAATFVAGLVLGSRWQYRRLLRQIYESAHG
jgi:sulfite exporter TauE/SafE